MAMPIFELRLLTDGFSRGVRMWSRPALVWFLLVFSLTASGRAQDALVRLGVEDAAGQPLNSVQVGDTFWLATYITDLRPNGDGVFSNYVDIAFDPASVRPLPESLEYSDLYPNGRAKAEKVFATAGLFDEVGSFGTLEAVGGDEQFQFRVLMQAESTGVASFEPSPPDEFLLHDFLLRGEEDAIPFSAVTYQGTSVSIVPEPIGAIPLLTAWMWCCAVCRRTDFQSVRKRRCGALKRVTRE